MDALQFIIFILLGITIVLMIFTRNFYDKIYKGLKTEDGFVDKIANAKNITYLEICGGLSITIFTLTSITSCIFYGLHFGLAVVLNIIGFILAISSQLLISSPEKNYNELRTKLLKYSDYFLLSSVILFIILSFFK